MTLAALKFKKRTQGTYVRLSFYVHYAKGFSLLCLLGQKITKASATALGGWLVFPILRASSLVGPQLLISATVLKGFPLLSPLYHIHFEITVDPCNLIGSQQCDLLLNHFFALNHFCSNSLQSCSKSRHFCFKSHHFYSMASFLFQIQMRCKVFLFPLLNKPAIRSMVLTESCDFKMAVIMW